MLRPIPVDGGERIVRVQQAVGETTGGLDAADLAIIRSAITTLTSFGSYAGREPALGRGFREEDQAPGAEPVIVLGDRAWRSVFGSDRSVVNRTVLVDGTPTRVIGVMPEGYGFPVASDAWVPLRAAELDGTAPGPAPSRCMGASCPAPHDKQWRPSSGS